MIAAALATPNSSLRKPTRLWNTTPCIARRIDCNCRFEAPPPSRDSMIRRRLGHHVGEDVAEEVRGDVDEGRVLEACQTRLPSRPPTSWRGKPAGRCTAGATATARRTSASGRSRRTPSASTRCSATSARSAWTPAELLAKLGDDEVFGVTVDTGWWATQGYDPARAIEKLGDRVLHVHLKDVRATGEPHETCRWGEGIVDIEACVRALWRIGYGGAIAVEHEPEDHDPSEACRAMGEQLRR